MLKLTILILSIFLFSCSNEVEQEYQPHSIKSDEITNPETTENIQNKTIIDSSSILYQNETDSIDKTEQSKIVIDPFNLYLYDPLNIRHPTVEEQSKGIKLKITWVDSISGDFSFTDRPVPKQNSLYFQTPESDSLFEARIAGMSNDDNLIINDSLEVFLSLVDTSRQYSIYSEQAPYGGTEGVSYMFFSNDKLRITGFSGSYFGNSMNVIIENNTVSAWTVWDIVNSHGSWKYVQPLAGGYINVDRALYKKGIIKAEFDFLIGEDGFDPEHWKGLIYGEVHK